MHKTACSQVCRNVELEGRGPHARWQETALGREYNSPLRWPLLDFLVLACMQHDLVRMSGGHTRVSLRPVVRNGISEDIASSVECSRSDGTGGWIEGCLSRKIRHWDRRLGSGKLPLSRVRASLSQKLTVPSEPGYQSVRMNQYSPTPRTASGESSVNRVERNVVNGKDH